MLLVITQVIAAPILSSVYNLNKQVNMGVLWFLFIKSSNCIFFFITNVWTHVLFHLVWYIIMCTVYQKNHFINYNAQLNVCNTWLSNIIYLIHLCELNLTFLFLVEQTIIFDFDSSFGDLKVFIFFNFAASSLTCFIHLCWTNICLLSIFF